MRTHPVTVIALHSLAEARRRRVLLVVVVLTMLFGALFAWGTSEVFDTIEGRPPGLPARFVSERDLAGATLVGLSMFAALFLGIVLATFLCAGAVRGGADSGELQPLLVRRPTRTQYLLARYLAAALTSVAYVLLTYFGAVLVVGWLGGWWPSEPWAVAGELVLAVITIAAIALLASVYLTATASGIFTLMLYAAGLVGGLMGAIAEGVRSERLEQIATAISWVLPFEGLYRDALHRLLSEFGIVRMMLQLGPLGSSADVGPALVPWALVFTAIVLGAAFWSLQRRDL